MSSRKYSNQRGWSWVTWFIVILVLVGLIATFATDYIMNGMNL